jgi:hypothetical protein
LGVPRERIEYPELKCALREQCQVFAANVVLMFQEMLSLIAQLRATSAPA